MRAGALNNVDLESL